MKFLSSKGNQTNRRHSLAAELDCLMVFVLVISFLAGFFLSARVSAGTWCELYAYPEPGVCSHYETLLFFPTREQAEQACINYATFFANYLGQAIPNTCGHGAEAGQYSAGWFSTNVYTYYRAPAYFGRFLYKYDPNRNLGDSGCSVGNPINMLTGNKFQEEIVYQTKTHFPLSVSFFYNSLNKEKKNGQHRYRHRSTTLYRAAPSWTWMG